MKWPFWTRTQPALLPELDDCEAIDPLLSLYADGMASPNEARRVETHLPGCDSCRELLAWMQATQRALAARPVVRPPAELRARIADAIAAASAAPVPAFGTRPARSFSLRPAYAAAASLTIVGLVSYSLLHHPTPAVHPPVASSPLVAAVPHEKRFDADRPSGAAEHGLCDAEAPPARLCQACAGHACAGRARHY